MNNKSRRSTNRRLSGNQILNKFSITEILNNCLKNFQEETYLHKISVIKLFNQE
jgi:hypothetical protein